MSKKVVKTKDLNFQCLICGGMFTSDEISERENICKTCLDKIREGK